VTTIIHNAAYNSIRIVAFQYSPPGMAINRITSEELAEVLQEKSVQVIDVRGSDFAGGHIRGAVNIPQPQFANDENVDQLIEQFKDKQVLVFHCMKRYGIFVVIYIRRHCSCF